MVSTPFVRHAQRLKSIIIGHQFVISCVNFAWTKDVASLYDGHSKDEGADIVSVLEGDGVRRLELRQAANLLDVGVGIVLGGRCPSVDDAPHGVDMVLVYVSAQTDKRCTETILHCFELNEFTVCLEVSLTEPFLIRASNVERVVVANAPCYCHKN